MCSTTTVKFNKIPIYKAGMAGKHENRKKKHFATVCPQVIGAPDWLHAETQIYSAA